jgi:hypothetical protein
VVSIEKQGKRSPDEILISVLDPSNKADFYRRIEEHKSYFSICLRECKRMNILMAEIKQSLSSLDKELSGELIISEARML